MTKVPWKLFVRIGIQKMNRPDWDQYFMTMAYLAASRSTDQSTHAGTVIVTMDNAVVSTGYNGPPRGMDNPPQTRPEKYFYFEHSERNAIYNAASHGTKLYGCKLYVNFLPCADCARAIIQSGIKEVIVHKEGQDSFNEVKGGDEWDASHKATLEILGELVSNFTGTGTVKTSILRWWSGDLWMPKGFFRGTEFDL